MIKQRSAIKGLRSYYFIYNNTNTNLVFVSFHKIVKSPQEITIGRVRLVQIQNTSAAV